MECDSSLIVIEGPNEVGKTTLAHRLAKSVHEHGIPCKVIAFPGNNNGSLGNLVKKIHENPKSFDLAEINPASLQLLHIAAHIDSIENRIHPLLKRGTNIILDRFWWSTFIYGRASGIDHGIINGMIEIEKQFWDGILPEKVFLIDRDHPLNSDVDFKLWSKIRNEYLNFAKSTEHRYPVEVISNNASIEEAVKRLKSSVEEVLRRSQRTTQ